MTARFSGRVVLITGASSGIGAALARAFAREGADLVLTARRLERLEALAREIEAGGRRVVSIRGDVTVDGDLERAVTQGREALGRIDVVVANAGFGVVGNLTTLGLDDYRRQFETNVFGVLRTVYASLDELRRTRGTLVIVGSVSGHLAPPGSSAYVMSKFAVRGLAEALGHELAPQGVSVVLVSPGLVESELRQIDNRGRFHPEAGDRAPRWLVVSADRAARAIVRAVARRRREAVITGHARLAVFMVRHLPWLVSWAIRTFGVRSRGAPVPRR